MITWQRGFNCLTLVCLWISYQDMRLGAEDRPRFVGSANCATATCHGGIAAVGPAWHSSSSVWQASDPHVGAGEVLWNQRSQQIVRLLTPTVIDSEAEYVSVLQQKCVSCHAPSAADVAARPDQQVDLAEVRSTIAAGVSCEACHGPASLWIGLHTQREWDVNQKSRDQLGMLATKTLLERTDTCTRCHVGSRTADGLIRDMNHDMIAAGHPALYFDMLQHQRRLPPHWDPASDKLTQTPAAQLANTDTALRWRVLAAAVDLSLQRREYPTQAVSPELSEFDCAACHHKLQLDTPRQHRSAHGAALWYPWYTSGLAIQPSREQLRSDQPDLADLLQTLAQNTKVQAERVISGPDIALQVHLQGLLQDHAPNSSLDFCSAAIWLDRVETVSQALAEAGSDTMRHRSRELISDFRRNILGYSRQTPSTFEKLLPKPWYQHDLERFSKELATCLGLDPLSNKP